MTEIPAIVPQTRDNLIIQLPGNREMEVPAGRSLLELSRSLKESFPCAIVAARVDNALKDLHFVPEGGAKINFIDIRHVDGMRIYRRSLSFLLIAAARELFPRGRVMVEHSLGKGLYCEIKESLPLTRHSVATLEKKMKELVLQDLPFQKERVSRGKAIEIFAEQGDTDKVQLLSYRPKEHLDIYSLGEVRDYLFGYLVPSSGYLQHFSLKFYMPGLILRFPDEEDPSRIPPYKEQPKLFEVFREAENWGEILGVDTVGALNAAVEKGEGNDIVRVAEALHEKKIAQVADTIAREGQRLKLILIAGPSSSGKTSFAQRLRIQLLVNGLKPLPISMDDYFKNRDDTPRDEKGEFDFESLEAVDVDLFNDHLLALIRGEEVEVPTFNFLTGEREFRGKRLRLPKGHLLMVEGIHGLNEKLTETIPRGRKLKIYVSALTSLNIDQHNRIHTTDTRLLRRMVRDNASRNHGAMETIKRWPSVRQGEEKNIFLFQEESDVMFNSALTYELAVLKPFVEPLLQAIPPTAPEHLEATRLLHFLQYILPLDPDEVPFNSILREFVGNSCFFPD
jgi:uridine kinase